MVAMCSMFSPSSFRMNSWNPSMGDWETFPSEQWKTLFAFHFVCIWIYWIYPLCFYIWSGWSIEILIMVFWNSPYNWEIQFPIQPKQPKQSLLPKWHFDSISLLVTGANQYSGWEKKKMSSRWIMWQGIHCPSWPCGYKYDCWFSRYSD